MVDSFHQYYVGHCPLSEVYLMYVMLSRVCSTLVFKFSLLCIYFEVSVNSCDHTRDL
jgi:hypothetical protein